MLFNSYVFILLFLPLCLVGYFTLNHFKRYTLAQGFLLVMSLWFYGYFNPSYLVIMLVSIVVNYGFTWIIGITRQSLLRKAELLFAVLVNLGVLFYFKYYDFFISNLNRFAHTDFTLQNVILPLGISFFTFQQVSYVVDSYRGEVMQYDFLQYASFVSYFPQLIAGPIVTHDELIPQFMDLSKKKFNWDNFAAGMYIFAMGLGKKVLIADVFGIAANWGYDNVTLLDTTNGILVCLAYTIQMYFDFSGYCDMAIGLGKMMNIDLPVNFDSPYKALTITEFWDRWHKTLTRFFTKYVYIPLGGSRRGRLRTYANVMTVFLVSGLWHGAGYTYVVWGALHGLFSVITRHWKTVFEKMHPVLSWSITFVFLNLTFIFFRSESLKNAMIFLNSLFQLEFGAVSTELISAFRLPEVKFIIKKLALNYNPHWLLALWYGFAMTLILSGKNAYERMQAFRPGVVNMILTYGLLVWCILSFSGVSTFLYFNF